MTDMEFAKLKAVELDIFKEFISVCEKLNLKYYLYGGTLLGAVRHKGFIPWDDDIDVAMFRKDFDIFVREAPKHLRKGLFLQTHESDPGFINDWAKIRDSGTAFVETNLKHVKMNQGIFIDVFPLDYCAEKNPDGFWENKLLMDERLIMTFLPIWKRPRDRMVLRPKAWLRYPKAEAAFQARKAMFQAVTEGNFVSHRGNNSLKERAIMPADWYGEGTTVEFEGLQVRAPKEFDQYLTRVYGDYMKLPPVEQQVSRHNTEVIDTEKSYLEYVKW